MISKKRFEDLEGQVETIYGLFRVMQDTLLTMMGRVSQLENKDAGMEVKFSSWTPEIMVPAKQEALGPPHPIF